MLKLRLFNFSQEDYQALATIHNDAYADSRLRATDFKRIDDYTPQDEYDWERTIAEWNGKPVGYGLYVRSLWLKDPDLYTIGWLTHPDFRRRGIASAYWDHLENEIFPERSMTGLLVDVRSDAPDGVPFVEKRGFEQTEVRTEMVLDLTTFDATTFAEQSAKVFKRGIEFQPLSDLMEADDDYLKKLVELANMQRKDEPNAEDQAPLTAEMFQNYYMSSDTFYPEGWFIATHKEKYVGWCAVLPNPKRPTEVSNGITVVRRGYRRIGIATAMKVHVAQHAQSMGAKQIRTSNISTNPMLSINKMLGYMPRYDSLAYRKLIKES